MHASEAVENIEFERSAALFLRRVASPSPGTFSLGVRYLDTTQRRPPGSLSARTAQNLDWRPATRQPESQIFCEKPEATYLWFLESRFKAIPGGLCLSSRRTPDVHRSVAEAVTDATQRVGYFARSAAASASAPAGRRSAAGSCRQIAVPLFHAAHACETSAAPACCMGNHCSM